MNSKKATAAKAKLPKKPRNSLEGSAGETETKALPHRHQALTARS